MVDLLIKIRQNKFLKIFLIIINNFQNINLMNLKNKNIKNSVLLNLVQKNKLNKIIMTINEFIFYYRIAI